MSGGRFTLGVGVEASHELLTSQADQQHVEAV
jgi:hypothetical protein